VTISDINGYQRGRQRPLPASPEAIRRNQ